MRPRNNSVPVLRYRSLESVVWVSVFSTWISCWCQTVRHSVFCNGSSTDKDETIRNLELEMPSSDGKTHHLYVVLMEGIMVLKYIQYYTEWHLIHICVFSFLFRDLDWNFCFTCQTINHVLCTGRDKWTVVAVASVLFFYLDEKHERLNRVLVFSVIPTHILLLFFSPLSSTLVIGSKAYKTILIFCFTSRSTFNFQPSFSDGKSSSPGLCMFSQVKLTITDSTEDLSPSFKEENKGGGEGLNVILDLFGVDQKMIYYLPLPCACSIPLHFVRERLKKVHPLSQRKKFDKIKDGGSTCTVRRDCSAFGSRLNGHRLLSGFPRRLRSWAHFISRSLVRKKRMYECISARAEVDDCGRGAQQQSRLLVGFYFFVFWFPPPRDRVIRWRIPSAYTIRAAR